MATLPHELLAIRIRNARLLACDTDEEMSVIEEKVIIGMCFGFFMQLTVYACDMITHLKLG